MKKIYYALKYFLVFLSFSNSGYLFAQQGQLDTSFKTGNGANNIVQQLELLAGDHVFAGGDFTTFNGKALRRMVRLFPDGRSDTSWMPFSSSTGGADGPIRSSTVQTDGKLLVGGLFNTVNGISSKNIARLDSTGAIDTTFIVGSGFNNEVTSLAANSSRIFAAGFFSAYKGTTVPSFTCLDLNGNIDNTWFKPTGSIFINTIATEPGGKVYIGGTFTSYAGTSINRVARLNQNGTLDNSFNPGTGPNSGVAAMRVQPDGKLLIAGTFTAVNGVTAVRIARLNTDGSVDTTFNAGSGVNSNIRTMTLHQNGKIYIGGDFTTVNGNSIPRIARLQQNGLPDAGFSVGSGTNGTVYNISIQRDGNIIFSGNFSQYNSVNVGKIVRVMGEPCRNPDTPQVSVSASVIRCPGGSTTFSASGNVYHPNGKWYWYRDFCGGNPIDSGSVITVSPTSSNTYYVQGSSPCGSSVCVPFNIQVTDTSAPVPILPSLPTQRSACSVNLSTPTAYDSCKGLIYGMAGGPVSFTAEGTYNVVWTYSDGNGNSRTQNQQVVISDSIAPVPDSSLLTPLVSNCSLLISNFPKATDNCVGRITATTTDSLHYSDTGTYTITWRYNDGRGNISTQPQQVIIRPDTVKPVPDSLSLKPILASCGISIANFPKATDNCSGKITATTTDTLSYSQQGTYTINWTYRDAKGNFTTQPQQVIIRDTLPPIPQVSSLPAIIGTCAVSISSFPKANDNCKGQLTATTTDSLNYNIPGSYTLRWNYNDGNGNTTSQNQQVIVTDTLAPIPDSSQLRTIVSVCSATVTTIPTATDQCVGKITGTTTDSLQYNNPGQYAIIWRYNDGRGNIRTQQQYVVVIDTLPPVPDLVQLPVVVSSCNASLNIIPTASDQCSGKITATTNDTLHYTRLGLYTVTWKFSDGNGNTSTQLQNVVVLDTLAPQPDFSPLPILTARCGLAITGFPTATDQCRGKISGTTSDPMTFSRRGTYTIHWYYNDSNGNSSSQNQNVVIYGLDTSIAINGSTGQLTSNYTSNSVTYQWFSCGSPISPIHAATNRSYQPTLSGNYGVIISDSGCADTSGCRLVNISSSMVKDYGFALQVKIYPIPADNILYIEIPERIDETEMKLYDIKGQLVNEQHIPSSGYLKLDVHGVHAGVYYLEIRTENGLSWNKVIIQ